MPNLIVFYKNMRLYNFSLAQKKVASALTIVIFFFFTISVSANTILCIEEDQTHLLEAQELSLSSCHTPNINTKRKTLELDHKESSCIDVVLSTSEASLRSSNQKTIKTNYPLHGIAQLLSSPSFAPVAHLSKYQHYQLIPKSFHKKIKTIVLIIWYPKSDKPVIWLLLTQQHHSA